VGALRRRRIVFAVGVVVLLGLHLFPLRRGAEPMIAGFLPWDLAYAVMWMFAATGLVLYLTQRVWGGQ
jgi:hypothetical protein